MADYSADMIRMVDARVAAAAVRSRAVGTFIGVDDAGWALVAFDGDPRPMQVKWAASMGWLIPDTRVLLDLYGGDWYISEAVSNKAYWPKWDTDMVTINPITNTSAALGSTVVGFTFKAPITGSVHITVSGHLSQSINGTSTYLGYQVRTGTDYAQGISLTGATFDFRRSLQAGEAVNTGARARSTASETWPLTGLTPGADYVIRTGHWITGSGSGAIDSRGVRVEPF